MNSQSKVAIFAILFRVEAKPGQQQQLVEFLEWDQRESLENERGTIRFDVFQDPDNANRFFVYEAYEDSAAFEEHKKHDPFKRWNSEEFQSEVVLTHDDLNPFTH